MPDVKRRQKAQATARPATKKTKMSAVVSGIPDISGIHLRGEETDSTFQDAWPDTGAILPGLVLAAPHTDLQEDPGESDE